MLRTRERGPNARAILCVGIVVAATPRRKGRGPVRRLSVRLYPVNESLGYGGTLDLIAELDGEVWLLDWKTGKSVASPAGEVYRDHRLQLAAYEHAEFIAKPGDPERYPIPAITRHGIVHVTDSGTVKSGSSRRSWLPGRRRQPPTAWACRTRP